MTFYVLLLKITLASLLVNVKVSSFYPTIFVRNNIKIAFLCALTTSQIVSLYGKGGYKDKWLSTGEAGVFVCKKRLPTDILVGSRFFVTGNKRPLFQVEKGGPSGVFRHVSQLFLNAEELVIFFYAF